MTLVDENRQREIKRHLAASLSHAHHACGGSAGNSVIAASQFGAPTYMSCLVANDEDGDVYIADLDACGVQPSYPGPELEESIIGTSERGTNVASNGPNSLAISTGLDG